MNGIREELKENVLSVKLALSCMNVNSLKVGDVYDCIVTDACISKSDDGYHTSPKIVKVQTLDKKYEGYLLCTSHFYINGELVKNCRMLTNKYNFFVDYADSKKALKQLVSFCRTFMAVLLVITCILVGFVVMFYKS